jgi:hypothetical protein
MRITKITQTRGCQCRACQGTYTMHAPVTEVIWQVEIPGARWDKEFRTKREAVAFVAQQEEKEQGPGKVQ